MKTTLDLSDDLLSEAKAVAARRRITLKAMIEHALRREIAPPVQLDAGSPIEMNELRPARAQTAWKRDHRRRCRGAPRGDRPRGNGTGAEPFRRMIHLPDVNVLLFLAAPESPFHRTAKAFFKRDSTEGWATCPTTENGFIRILGSPKFPGGPGSARLAREIIGQWKSHPGYQFCPDDLSLCDTSLFPDLPDAKHLTDCYLLALAVKRGGRFATFDRRIDPAWVPGDNAVFLPIDAAMT